MTKKKLPDLPKVSELPNLPPEPPSIPDALQKAIDKAGSDASTEFSKFRTRLSEYRTELSEHRTSLSDHRTDLSEHRTGLSDARSHMSNERTHLSQVRTSLALMTFGITLNRFSITLMESNRMPETRSTLSKTEDVGIGMVALGILILIWSLYRYEKVYKQIETMSYKPPRFALSMVTLTIILLGAASTIWMILG